MRVLIVALLLVPLSGCLGGVGLLETDLFDYIEVERGDPTPIALDDCSALLETLNLRAEQHALVSLHQSYEGHNRHFGFGDVVMEEAAGDSASDDGAQAAPSGTEGARSTQDAEVTGTNNQEQDVDEADIIKTDGTWTYVVDGRQLRILHSNTVGNLTLRSTTDLSNDTSYGGHGGQILLIDRGTEDDSDDRIVILRTGVSGPEPTEPDEKQDADRSSAVVEDSSFYDGGGYSDIQVFDVGDRDDPERIARHLIEGSNVGARLVDGVVYVVVHQRESYLGLRTQAGPDDELLKDEGLTWGDYYDLSEPRRKEILLKSVEDAIEHNEQVLSDLSLADHLPGRYHSDPDGDLVPHSEDSASCRSVLTTPDDMGRSLSTIFSLDADGVSQQFQVTQILGGHPIVYGAQDALVLASSSQEHWWFWAQPDLEEATNLHWFDLDGLDVDHRASGRVVGIVQDQFGIDVHDDQLRVATTTGTWGRWWLEDPDPMMNHVFVFAEAAGQLVPTGSVGGIAPEERLWSARFTDDRAYLITFEQIDPLWIIDLTDPIAPTILGELEIPGVSTYIHPLPGEDALLTIGLGPREGPDGEERGLDWSRIQVSLFDISDPTAPTRADVLDISLPAEGGDSEVESYSWGSSAAVHEHKAFTYWDKLGMLAVPVSWQHYERSCEQDGSTRTCTETQEFHTGLDLISVDRHNMTLERYGSVDQDHMMSQEGEESGRYWGVEVQRSYFLGFPDQFPDEPVSVYAYSPIGISAHDLETLEDQDSVRFQGGQEEHHGEPQPLLEDVEGIVVA